MRGFQQTVKDKVTASTATCWSQVSDIILRKNNLWLFYRRVIPIPLRILIKIFRSTRKARARENGWWKVMGIIVKALESDMMLKPLNRYDWREVHHSLTSGYSNEMVISTFISISLGLPWRWTVILLFKSSACKEGRWFGIYETNLSEYFCSRVVLSDLRMIKRWTIGQIV